MLRLPEELRDAFKDPLGPVYTDAEALLGEIDRTRETIAEGSTAQLIAVGDVVTHHIRAAGRDPDVAVIDGKTERETVDDEIRRALEDAGETRVTVDNPAAELSAALLEAITGALDASVPTVVEVDGEEDLATLPAIVAAPIGSSVVYGQPGEGMVHVQVTREKTEEALDLLRSFAGDTEGAIGILTD